MVVKEVKLMAQNEGIRIHQYLDNWLVRATSQTFLHYTQTLVALFHELGWIINMEKSELEPKQIFHFVGYQYNLRKCKVKAHFGTLVDLKVKKVRFRSFSPTCCRVRQLMSLIGLLTAREKEVHLG